MAASGLMMCATAAAQVPPPPSPAGPAICTITNGAVTPLMRAEGLTEVVGDIIIACSGGTPVAAGATLPQAVITLFLNTAVTSRLQDSNGGTEALLIVDEPGSGEVGAGPASPQLACPTPLTGCTVVSNGVDPYDGSAGHPNVFQGVSSGNTISFQVPISAPGNFGVGIAPNTFRIFRITNVRVNASALSNSPTTNAPLPAVASISAGGSSGLPIGQATLTVGFVQRGLNYTTRNDANTATVNSVDLSACSAGSPCGAAVLQFQENFGTAAFKPRLQGTAQNIPGTIYISESGFYNPRLAASSPEARDGRPCRRRNAAEGRLSGHSGGRAALGSGGFPRQLVGSFNRK